MVATAIYSVTMVLWKETAFPLCRAVERRWNCQCYYYYYYKFLEAVLNSQGLKKLRYAIQKRYKNQAGMNLTPPPPSLLLLLLLL